MRMRMTFISGICAALFSMGGAVAMPVDMTVDRLLNICGAPTVQKATAKGDELGWQRMTNAETEEWRAHFVGYNGGSVELVGWRRNNAAGPESLSFWVAVGPNGHKACTYSTMQPAGLLDALSERLGAPDTLDGDSAAGITSAAWKRDAVVYSFTQVGSSATVSVGPS